MPTQLVAAFRATLEEIRDASLLLHVVDASHPSAAAQVDAVNKVLKDLEVVNVPTITVWNKVRLRLFIVILFSIFSCQNRGAVIISYINSIFPSFFSFSLVQVDACADPVAVEAVASRRDGTVCVSALTGRGVESLLGQTAARLEEAMIPVQVLIPYSQGDLVDEIHRCGVVKATEYTAEGTEVCAHVPPSLASRLAVLAVDTRAPRRINI